MKTFPDFFNFPTAVINQQDFLSSKEIEKVLKFTENLSSEGAKIGNSSQNDNVLNNNVRRSNVKWIPKVEEIHWLYAKIYQKIHMENSLIWKFKLKDFHEDIQYTEYHGEQKGQYDWHVDVGANINCFRKLSLTIQLSDPSEHKGGYLQLHNYDNMDPEYLENTPGNDYYIKTIKKRKGTITLFPSFTPHRVSPVVKGVRKSLVLWVGGCPFK